MIGDVPKKRKHTWNSNNSKHGDEIGMCFHVCLALKINKLKKKHLVCWDGKSNYLIPRMDYVKAFSYAFRLLMFDCNSNRISFSAGIKEHCYFFTLRC